MCETQKQKISAEAQTKQIAQAEADFSGLQQTIKYLAEREANLSKYSDKLRENLQKIANQFGSEKECAVCGYTLSSGWAHGHYKWVKHGTAFNSIAEMEKASGAKMAPRPQGESRWGIPGENIEFYEENAEWHTPQPKNQISIRVQDTEAFNLDQPYENPKTLVLDGTLQIGFGQGVFMQNQTLEEASRYTLKQLVKSGRLPKFLKLIAEKLTETEQEYKAVAEAAEKMAASLTS